jgi:hypothetical protein
MKNVKQHAANAVAGSRNTTAAYKPQPQPTAERIRAVEQLFSRNYGSLTDAALAGKHVTATEGSDVTARIAENLHHYHGPIDDAPFLRWAYEVAQPVLSFLEIQHQCERYVFAAIYKVLKNCDGLGVNHRSYDYSGRIVQYGTVDEIASDVWIWTLEHLDELSVPGKAKLTTRMSERAMWTARAWKTKQIRQRDKTVNIEGFLLKEQNGTSKPKPIVLGPGDEDAYLPVDNASNGVLEAHDIPVSDEMFHAA